MGKLKSANSISKIGLYFLLFISILTLCFISGCVVQATPGQVVAAKQQNVLLGQGFSSAVYPVNIQQAMDAVAPVGQAHNAACDREYILVTTSGKNGQWMEKRPGMPPLESCQSITGYIGRWRLASISTTTSPAGVNLTALASRFTSTWRTRVTSPRRAWGTFCVIT